MNSSQWDTPSSSWNSLLPLSSLNLHKDTWERIEAKMQRKCPQMKSRKNLSEKLISDVRIRLTELHFLFLEKSVTTLFGITEKGYFLSHWSLRRQRMYPQMKVRKKLSGKLLWDCEFITVKYTFLFMKQFATTVLVESANR